MRSRPGLLAAASAELVGRDLACWCRLTDACDADVLLGLVNGEDSDASPVARPAAAGEQ